MAETAKCHNCGRSIRRAATGRPPKWCSRGCRQRAYERRRLLAAEERGREQAIEELRNRKLIA